MAAYQRKALSLYIEKRSRTFLLMDDNTCNRIYIHSPQYRINIMQDTRERLKALMGKGESSEIEFKSARGGIPASLWESYSAFANTDGGIIVLGIQEKKRHVYFGRPDGRNRDTLQKELLGLRTQQGESQRMPSP